jgi:hypothetical protein
MASEHQHPHNGEGENSWEGDFDPFADPEERRVLFAAFDSFRYVDKHLRNMYWRMTLALGSDVNQAY